MIRKTKIVATLGPASFSKEVLKQMISKGVNVCRLNFSHLPHSKAKEVISTIKEINQELQVHTAILADLQGPKIRVGDFKTPIELTKGDEVIFSTDQNMEGAIYINYSSFAKDVKSGNRILLDDGKIHLEVAESNGKNIVKAIVVSGGLLQSRKGVNLPDTQISLPSLTTKDLDDLAFILKEKIEWIGLSFVRSAEDIRMLKTQIAKSNTSVAKVVAKIEKPEAIQNIDKIIAETDAVMVARGDLGVEVPLHKVPVYQKMIVRKCIENARPVIIATQMLESMTDNVYATRAEVNDVANSVIDGADALMLSGETSVGKHPIKVVDTMRNIIRDVEGSRHNISKQESKKEIIRNERFLSASICATACQLAEQTRAKAIITITHSGYNTITTSSFRPHTFIYAFTDNHSILNTLSLVWGVLGFYYDKVTTTSQAINDMKEILLKNKHINKGDTVINVASMPANEKGMTNMLKISKV